MADTVSFSFELFPPRTPEGSAKLPATIAQLAAVKPAYFSVTYGAGGSEQDGTYETVVRVVAQTGVEAAPHLTCVGSTREKIAGLLNRYRGAGVKRIVALRGDMPSTSYGTGARGDFHYANELVQFIRESQGEAFEIEVAAYPEMHPQAVDADADFEAFRRKVDAGAHAAITQYFFVAEAYFDFVERCAKAGIHIPVIAGIMPIVNHAQLTRFSAACGADIPRWLRLRLERVAHDKTALQDFGLEVVTRLCEQLLKAGAPGIHFYTLNQAEPTLRLWRNLGLPVPTMA